MQISINNLGGIQHAALPLPRGVTLIAGGNGAGKSTVLRALAACLTRDPIPLRRPDGKPAILKGQSRMMISAKIGGATWTDDNGETAISWPANKVNITGDPAAISPMVAGMVQWMALSETERLTTLAAALDRSGQPVTPSLDDLSSALADTGEEAKPIWQLIQTMGWDQAALKISTRWSEATGAWRAVAREAYGAQKAATWTPPGWESDLAGASEANLNQDVAAAQQAVEDGIARKAVDASTVEELQRVADQPAPDITAIKERIAALRAEGIQRTTERQAMADSLVAAPAIPALPRETNRNAACPSCGVGLFVSVRTVDFKVAVETVTTPEILDWARADAARIEAEGRAIEQSNREVRERIGLIDQQIAALRAEIGTTERQLYDAERIAAARADAAQRIKSLTAAAGDVSEETITALRADATRAVGRLRAWHAKKLADQEAANADRLSAVRALLLPDGLRAAKLAGAMQVVNAQLTAICQTAHWPVVHLTPTMDLFFAGRSYVACSRSEQLRAQITMQVLLAKLESAPLILIDEADMLDSAGRLGLIHALHQHMATAVVAMTAKRDYAIAIASQFARTWWLDGGTATIIGEGEKQ